MTVLTAVVGVVIFAVFCAAVVVAWAQHGQQPDRYEDGQDAEAAIDSIRGSLRPMVDGETVARSTDFGALQEESGRPHVRAGSTWRIE